MTDFIESLPSGDVAKVCSNYVVKKITETKSRQLFLCNDCGHYAQVSRSIRDGKTSAVSGYVRQGNAYVLVRVKVPT